MTTPTMSIQADSSAARKRVHGTSGILDVVPGERRHAA